jgi:hypothetical protein
MGVLVRDDPLGDSEMWKNVAAVELCNSCGINSFCTWDKQGRLGAVMVCDHKDSVKTLRSGKVSDEIHGHCVKGKRVGPGCNRMKRDTWPVSGRFGDLARGTTLNVCRDERALVQPPIGPSN